LIPNIISLIIPLCFDLAIDQLPKEQRYIPVDISNYVEYNLIPIRSLYRIFSKRKKIDDDSFTFINDIRVLALFWVIFGHSIAFKLAYTNNVLDVRDRRVQLFFNPDPESLTFFGPGLAPRPELCILSIDFFNAKLSVDLRIKGVARRDAQASALRKNVWRGGYRDKKLFVGSKIFFTGGHPLPLPPLRKFLATPLLKIRDAFIPLFI
jgi:hypothetical protein